MSTADVPANADRDALKRAAAEAAVELVEEGMVVGLGTGSTAATRRPRSKDARQEGRTGSQVLADAHRIEHGGVDVAASPRIPDTIEEEGARRIAVDGLPSCGRERLEVKFAQIARKGL